MLHAIPEQTLEELRRHFDIKINFEDRALPADEPKQNVRGRSAIVSLLTDHIDHKDGAILNTDGPQCRIVANFAVGDNNFDVEVQTKRGVVLTNTPGVLDDATSTHTLALLLAAACRIPEAERYIRTGQWTG